MAKTATKKAGKASNGRKRAVKGKASRDRQTYISGTEPQFIKEIDKAALDYVGFRDERMSLNKNEIETKETLLALMHKHKLDEYITSHGLTVTRETIEETVKVRKKSGRPRKDD